MFSSSFSHVLSAFLPVLRLLSCSILARTATQSHSTEVLSLNPIGPWWLRVVLRVAQWIQHASKHALAQRLLPAYFHKYCAVSTEARSGKPLASILHFQSEVRLLGQQGFHFKSCTQLSNAFLRWVLCAEPRSGLILVTSAPVIFDIAIQLRRFRSSKGTFR